MKKGFTLAEVLITLAIIGVVAAMTIPTIVANYQEKSWSTAASVFNRNLGESLRTMNVYNELTGLSDTETFVANLSKHMKISTTCDNTKLTSCFSDEVVWNNETVATNDIKTASNLGKDDWNTNVVGFQLVNGTSGLIAYNPNCDGNVRHTTSGDNVGLITECVAVVFDTSGRKTPNSFGKDLRTVNVDSLAKNEVEYTWDYLLAQCGEHSNWDCLNPILTGATEEECNGIPYIDNSGTTGTCYDTWYHDGFCEMSAEKCK